MQKELIDNSFEAVQNLNLSQKDLEKLKKLIFDDTHFSIEQIKLLGWQAIHSDTGGNLGDSEYDIISSYCRKNFISTIYVTTPQLIQAIQKEPLRVLTLKEITASAWNNAELAFIGIEDLPGGKPYEEYAWADKIFLGAITWGDSFFFSWPLSFAVLREHDSADDKSWTSIAGPTSLIQTFKKESEYVWEDGSLPLHIHDNRSELAINNFWRHVEAFDLKKQKIDGTKI